MCIRDRIFIDGKQVAITGVNSARANGISIIHQELVLVPYMTVAENIFLGREPMGAFGVNKSKMSADAQKMLDRFDLGIDADSLIADLSIAQQQMVEIVKAISFNCRIPVSYTHLDVYKRQGRGGGAARRLRAACPA